MSDHIEKSITLNAPQSRVWRAITDYREFGEWFRVRLEQPFAEGEVSNGQITHPGFEHVKMTMSVTSIRPESYFAYRWHPYASDPATDFSLEEPTLVEFHLAPEGQGTRLVIRESGFDRLPEHRRVEAFRMNSQGWEGQIRATLRGMSAMRHERPETLATRAALFAALGDATRLSVLSRLSDGAALSITALTEGAEMTRQAVSKHLRVLEEAGVVKSVRAGRESLFALDPQQILAARDYLDSVSQAWDDALGRLKNFVESGPAGEGDRA